MASQKEGKKKGKKGKKEGKKRDFLKTKAQPLRQETPQRGLSPRVNFVSFTPRCMQP
jgi:hypothetical protein